MHTVYCPISTRGLFLCFIKNSLIWYECSIKSVSHFADNLPVIIKSGIPFCVHFLNPLNSKRFPKYYFYTRKFLFCSVEQGYKIILKRLKCSSIIMFRDGPKVIYSNKDTQNIR